MGNRVEATSSRNAALNLSDRLYLRRKYGLNRLAVESLDRMGVALADAVHFLEARLKRGLPAHPVWTSSPGV